MYYAVSCRNVIVDSCCASYGLWRGRRQALLLYWEIVGYGAVSGSKLLFLEVVFRRVKESKPLIRQNALSQGNSEILLHKAHSSKLCGEAPFCRAGAARIHTMQARYWVQVPTVAVLIVGFAFGGVGREGEGFNKWLPVNALLGTVR